MILTRPTTPKTNEPAAVAAELPVLNAPGDRLTVWRALLWGEWFAHSRILLIFLVVWLAAVWVLPLFTHTGWILVLGGLYALMAGPLYGGGDVLDGSEEFSFSLPPTRAQRFCARALVGGGSLLLLTAMNLIALGLDLPQILAGLYIKTGLIQPRPVLRPGLLYGLVVALPLAIFAFAFTISALTHSRMVVLIAWFWASLGGLSLLQIGFWYEQLVWDKLNGYFAFPLLFGSAVTVMALGCARFQRKEIGHPSRPLTLPSHWWVWILFFVIGLGLALALVSSLSTQFPQLLSDARR